MPLNEGEVMEALGEIKAEVRNLKESQRVQGERLGYVEREIARLNRNGNNSGWRQKATYAGGGGIGIAGLIEIAKYFFGGKP